MKLHRAASALYTNQLFEIKIWPQDSDGCFSEVHIMMQLHGFKAEGQREMILLSKRSCPHLPGKMHDLKSRNSFLHHWLCAVRVQASTCNLYLRLSTGFFFFLENQTWLTWSLKILVSVWSDSLGCRAKLQELQLLSSLLHQGIKVDVARSADSPDKKKTCFLFLWLQQPLRKI